MLNVEPAVATAPDTIEDIQRRMAEIRHDLHQDVQEVVATAEAVTDWRRYIRMYPWATMGVAFVVGYVIVPKRRRPSASEVATKVVEEQARVAAEPRRVPEAVGEPRAKGLLGGIWSLAAPVAIRAAQGYAVQYLENWILQQQQTMAAAGPEPVQPPGPKPSGGTGYR